VQAETAACPELRLVAVMHNDDLSCAESFGLPAYRNTHLSLRYGSRIERVFFGLQREALQPKAARSL